MGYSTQFELTWKTIDGKSDPKVDAKVARYIENHESMSYALESDGSTACECKWYEHKDDMREMSKKIKNVIFHLAGEGEESGDVWDLFAWNGKIQEHQAEIVRVEKPRPEDWE